MLPHLPHLPGWTIGLTALVLLWRGQLAVESGPLPSKWVLVSVLTVAIGLTYWSYGSLLGKEPGVTLAVALMALKTLELRARRDAFVVFFLGFFIILTHFLYSQSLVVAVAMLISIWGLLTALVLAHMPVGQPSLRQAAGLAARTALLGAPVMALLFVLFPRIGPLWGVPQDGISTTGLSNTMRMGSVTEVARDESVAMRIRFDGIRPFPSQMYFRGPVLTRFDGIEWRPLGLPFAPAGVPDRLPALQPIGQPVRYEATLEPLRVAVGAAARSHHRGRRRSTAFASVGAKTCSGSASGRSTSGSASRPRPIRATRSAPRGAPARSRRASSCRPASIRAPSPGPGRCAPSRRTATSTRPRFTALVLRHIRERRLRLHAVARRIRPQRHRRVLARPQDRLLRALRGRLRRGHAGGRRFRRASSPATRAPTPSRSTATSSSGRARRTPGPSTGRPARAGSAPTRPPQWRPTGSAAARRLQVQPGLVAGAFAAMSPELVASLRSAWEALNNRWNQWVLNYTRGQQLDVLKNLGFTTPDWETLALLLIGTLSSLALAGAAWAWLDRHRVDPWVRQLERLKKALRSLGIAAAPHEAPRTLAARVRDRLGDRGEPLAAAARRARDAALRPRPGAAVPTPR